MTKGKRKASAPWPLRLRLLMGFKRYCAKFHVLLRAGSLEFRLRKRQARDSGRPVVLYNTHLRLGVCTWFIESPDISVYGYGKTVKDAMEDFDTKVKPIWEGYYGCDVALGTSGVLGIVDVSSSGDK